MYTITKPATFTALYPDPTTPADATAPPSGTVRVPASVLGSSASSCLSPSQLARDRQLAVE
jgi:hypothetical protein